MKIEPVQFRVDGAVLAAERWAGTGVPVVLLHAGVADRRGWYATARRLTALGTVVASEDSGQPSQFHPYRHGERPPWGAVPNRRGVGLVGRQLSGGQVALAHPDRVAGLVLIAPAAGGAPGRQRLDPDTQRLSDLLDIATATGDLEEVKPAADLDLARTDPPGPNTGSPAPPASWPSR